MYIAISQSTCHYASEGRQSASLLDEWIATLGWQYQDTLTDKSESLNEDSKLGPLISKKVQCLTA